MPLRSGRDMMTIELKLLVWSAALAVI